MTFAGALPTLPLKWSEQTRRNNFCATCLGRCRRPYRNLWCCLLQVVSPPEVSFQKDCSPAEVRSLMRSTMDGTDKKLEALAGRVRKHLGGGALFNVAWAAVKEALLAR